MTSDALAPIGDSALIVIVSACSFQQQQNYAMRKCESVKVCISHQQSAFVQLADPPAFGSCLITNYQTDQKYLCL